MTAAAPPPAPKRSGFDLFIFWYLGFSSLALAALIIIVVILVFGNDRLTRAQQQANITQCQAQNVTRVQDIAIWDRLLSVSPAAAKAETAAQRAEVADLERLVKIKDTPRDCAAAFGK